MRDTENLIQEELYYQNNTATLFHRTSKIENIDKILKTGWGAGSGRTYGEGVYTTYILNDQFQSYMGRYGDVLVKFKYTGLDNLLCFSSDVAYKVHGKNYLLIDQIKKLVPDNKLTEDDLLVIESLQKTADKATYSSEAAYEFVRTSFFPELHAKINGIEYNGSHDGHCVVIYPPGKGLELIAYDKNAPVHKDVTELNWIGAGTKKTFTKAFSKGIFIKPEIELPLPVKPDEKVRFMDFLKILKEKNEITDTDVITLFTYSFSIRGFFNIFEKLNPNLIRSYAYLEFFVNFSNANAYSAKIKVLETALKHRPSDILEYLHRNYNTFDEKFKTVLSHLVFTTDLTHLGEHGKYELGKTFTRIISDPKLDKVRIKQNIINYILKNNLHGWFKSVTMNNVHLLFSNLFATSSDVIDFIKLAKTHSNFDLNNIISYFASWFNNIPATSYTDDDLLNVIELLKDYSNTGKYFNSNEQGPVAYRLGNIYLTKHPEKITAELLPSIISSVTEQNVDELSKINPTVFKSADRIVFWESLKNTVYKSSNTIVPQKIWKYALLSTCDHTDYIEILNNIPSDSSSNKKSEIWEVWFKNIVSTYILTISDIESIIKKLNYPSDSLRNLILDELSNANQFDRNIFYLILKSRKIFDNNKLIAWFDKIDKQYPNYIKSFISYPEFANVFLSSNTFSKTTIPAYLYLKYAPELIEKLTSDQLESLLSQQVESTDRIFYPVSKQLLSVYISSDKILNTTNKNLREVIFSRLPILINDDADKQKIVAIIEKLITIDPNLFVNLNRYYLEQFIEICRDKEFAIDIIIKYKNVNLDSDDMASIFNKIRYGFASDYQKTIINQILEIKKNTLDERSVNQLITQIFFDKSVSSIDIIELFKKYNPNYIKDIYALNWVSLIIGAKNQTDYQYVENTIFSLPISVNTNSDSVKSELIENSFNPLKTINRMLDSNKFTINEVILQKILQYANDSITLNKVIKLYNFDAMTGKKMADLFNLLGNTDSYGESVLKNNKQALRLFLNEIGNRLNAVDEKEQVSFLANAYAFNNLTGSPVQLIAMQVRNITTLLFQRMLLETMRYNYQIRGPSNILKIILKYNNTGWNVENFFKAVNDNQLQNYYYSETGLRLNNNDLFALTLKVEGKNLQARTLKAMLDNSKTVEDRKKIINIVLNPEVKGSNLSSNDVFVIMSTVNQMYDDTYATPVVLNILRLVNENITDNMIANLVSLCPETINNQNGPEYVASRILLYRQNNLTESAIYNLIRLVTNDESRLRIINKILAIQPTPLTKKTVYNIFPLIPINGLRDVINKLLVLYFDKELIIRLVKNRGLDPATILTELKNYKKYYSFLNIIN